MILRSGQTVAGQFTTSRADTGAAANADTTPAGTLVLNGVDNAAAVTITNPSTGVYKWSVTLPTLAFGDLVQVRIAATVNSVTGKAIVWRDGKDLSIDASGNYSGSLTAAERTAIAAAVEAAILNEGDGQAVQQAIVNKINATDTNLAGLTLSAIAAAVWDALTSGMTTASSIGKLILDNLNAAITSRPTAAELDAQLSGTHGSGTWSGGESTTVTITPLLVQANNPRFTTRDIAPIIVGSAPADVFIVLDGNSAPVDLTGKTLRLVAFKYDNKVADYPFDDVFTGVFKYETGSGLTVGAGTNSNLVTLQHSTNNTAVPLDGKYILWNVTDRIPCLRGKLPIVPGVFDL